MTQIADTIEKPQPRDGLRVHTRFSPSALPVVLGFVECI